MTTTSGSTWDTEERRGKAGLLPVVASEGRGFESEGTDPAGCGSISVACDSEEGARGSVALSSAPVAGLGGGGAKSQGRGTIAAGMILVKELHQPKLITFTRKTDHVAAHTTPWPLFWPWIALNSKSINWPMYRTKGRISRTPPFMVDMAVRTLIRVCATD